MVNLSFVKNDSYEKGTDLMVVNVYLKEICREISRVLFREQDFTLIFQTRWVCVHSVLMYYGVFLFFIIFLIN